MSPTSAIKLVSDANWHWRVFIVSVGFWWPVSVILYSVQSICTLKIASHARETNQTKIYFLFFLKYLKFVPQSTKPTALERCSWMNILINIEPEEWRGSLKEKNSCFIFLGIFVFYLPKLTLRRLFIFLNLHRFAFRNTLTGRFRHFC